MNLKKWEDYNFESSSGLTEEFNDFYKDFRKYIKNIIPSNYSLVKINRGHFYVSGFIKNNDTEKYVYFSCSDVRFSKDEWKNRLLIRTAKHEEDYTGGSNNFTSLDRFNDNLTILSN